jgi:putative protease
MKLISVVDNIEQAKVMKANDVNEVIVGNMLFSKYGKVSPNRYNDFTKELKELELRVVFDWDILMTQSVFNERIKEIEKIDFSTIDAIRVADPGALFWCKENLNKIPIQLNLENGNHNLIGIEKWIEIAGSTLERVILSIELSKTKLEEYCSQLNTPIEFFGLGRIPLFYTPRSLVSPYLLDHEDDQRKELSSSYIEIEGSSEESPHKGFPIIENIHGTFMFNTKDQFLLDQVSELKDMGISFFRFDTRHCSDLNIIASIAKQFNSPSEENSLELKNAYDGVVIRGFYHVNKSDVLFKKLKNQRTQRKDELFLGEVLDVKKKKHLGLMIKNKDVNLLKGQEIILKTPDGKIKQTRVERLLNSQGQEVSKASAGEIVFISHLSAISVKTLVYAK